MLSPIPERPPGAMAEASSTLRLLRGQLDEMTCLLERQAPCMDLLSRIFAAQAALRRIQRGLVRHHLQVCLRRIAQATVEPATQRSLTDISELYGARRIYAVSALTTHHIARSGAEERSI